ncbi:unnamed protein product [Anisakis simplex]|uniref:Zinc finger protein n=1 Tax=Anisakis simplex TaxID=6269 RepID=A0A0M3K2G1_ANISI|nr:unnamed protein product [Anisakis simplex]
MDEELLSLVSRNALIDEIFVEDVHANAYPAATIRRIPTDSSLPDLEPEELISSLIQYFFDVVDESRNRCDDVMQEMNMVDKRCASNLVGDDVTYAEQQQSERYFGSFEQSVGVVEEVRSNDANTAQRSSFNSALSFNGTSLDEITKSSPQQTVQITPDEAPQLTYEGEVDDGVVDQRDSEFDRHASVQGSPSNEQLDSSCPVLVNERQQEPYVIEEAEVASKDDHQKPSTSMSSSASDGKWVGANPLRRFSVLIGNKKLSFKVIDAPRTIRGEQGTSLMDQYGSNGEQRSKCFICGRIFPSRAAFKEHQLQHGNSKPNICSYCGRSFIHRQSLTMHERIHTGEKPFQCPICTKCFARQTNYNIHMKLHASGRRYFCSFCGKWYRTEHEMLDHQQQCLAQIHGAVIHTDRPLRYQCSYCEKMFHHRRDKNIHERTHTGERPYSCGYCGKGFTQSQALTIHIRTHTGERPYTCSICAKDFRDSSALRKHEFMKHTSSGLPITYQGLSDLMLMSVPSSISNEPLQSSLQ